ncbi:MAG: extracellular solute-binding protein [Firmicutes bacterium]|jgi:ABC-type glycerol-3-phosphate transport system substrate-binding protein|nr:extracellular solute-binding protein [Bacillota bacterium]
MQTTNKIVKSFAMMIAILTLVCLGSAARVKIEHAAGSGHGQVYIDATMEIAALFNQLQDEITVEVTVVAGNEPLIVRTAAGVPPDTFTAIGYGDLAGRDMLLPLDSFLKKDDLAKAFVPASLEQGRWLGQLVQLPLFAQPAVTYYNTWLFEAAGVQSPNELAAQEMWTWDTLVDVGRKISADKSGDGILDIYATGGSWVSMERLVFWLGQSGAYYFDKLTNPTATRIKTPEFERALTFVHSLAHEHHITEVSALIGMPLTKFSNGEAGTMFDGPWRIAKGIRDAGMPNDAWDIAPMLTGPGGNPAFIHCDGVQISSITNHPEEAWTWASFLAADPRSTQILMDRVQRPTAHIRTLMRYTEMITVEGYPKHANTFWDILTTATTAIRTVPLIPNTDRFYAVHSAEIRSFLEGRQSVVTTLERLDHAFSQLLKED